MRSLSELVRHGFQKHAENNPQTAPPSPTREEVLNYLGQLASDYHIPPKVVYALADAESSLHVKEKHVNPERRGKQGNVTRPETTDYGLMGINSSNIGSPVKGAGERPFKIGEDVKTDWRANARAGVALFTPGYRLAELEQGPGATVEDHAQQAYSQYNSGSPRMRDRYLKQRKDGLPQDGVDRNFLQKFRKW